MYAYNIHLMILKYSMEGSLLISQMECMHSLDLELIIIILQLIILPFHE